MCGMPYHAAPGYIAKLIQAGRRVAICDQTSEPQPGKIVTREITQIITAGTVSELDLLRSNRSNYLGAIYFQDGAFGFAYAELSTGEFRVTQSRDTSTLMDDLTRISPAELLVSERQSAQLGEIEGALAYDDFAFLAEHARFTLCEHFGVKSLDGFGCTDMPAAIGAAGAIIHYLKQQLRRKVDHLTSLRCDARDNYVMLDAATQVNLELVESRGTRNTSLLAALDRTVTPMGGRKLRSWLLQPLRDLAELERRQQMIADLLHEPDLIAALRHSLKSIRDLDELRQASRDGKNWITELQEREIAESGIKSLKVRFNSVFGYFIEITKSNLANVPARYIRKQTTVGGERFITPELKEMETKILGADERARQLEYQLFQTLRDETLRELAPIQQTAGALGTLDVICALAETARLFAYSRPILNKTLKLVIRDGRHPVLDQNLAEEKFVPNDTDLDGERIRLAIITGPNMAGKSTYIRQVALIVLMAQTGSFVPAASVEIGLVDRIFTRVGANDDLARGQSTFMVEMNETSNIVNNATERSLVILDEIGRGTSTFDGLSIAWSVAEFLHDKIKARTLFAQHYHELTKLAAERKGVCNFNVAVREWNEQIIFLRKIIPGGADKSYGIQVARLAGLPKAILDRAKDILAHLENPNTAAPHAKQGKRRTTKSM